MEGSGSETSKRPRLGPYDGSHAMQPQLSIAQSHNYAGHTLPPPNPSSSSGHYIPQPQAVPQSPYHDAASHELRNLPEPTPHAYVQAHSGHSTPIRDQRPFPSDTSYSRRGSASGSTRSPDEYQQYPSSRSLSIAASNERQHYSQQYPLDHAGHQAYTSHDPPMNGNTHHGLPMPTSYGDQNHTPTQGHPIEYGQSPVNAMQHPYGGPLLSVQSSYQNMQKKKGTRAQQVCTPIISKVPVLANYIFRLAMPVVQESPSATKQGPCVATAGKTIKPVHIKLLHRQSQS